MTAQGQNRKQPISTWASAKRRKQDAARLSPAHSRPSKTGLTRLRDCPSSPFRRLSKLNGKLMSSRADHAGKRLAAVLFAASPAARWDKRIRSPAGIQHE